MAAGIAKSPARVQRQDACPLAPQSPLRSDLTLAAISASTSDLRPALAGEGFTRRPLEKQISTLTHREAAIPAPDRVTLLTGANNFPNWRRQLSGRASYADCA